MIARVRQLLSGRSAAAEAELGRFVAGRGQTSALGYDAIVTKGKRRAPSGKLMFEERELMEQQRRLLVSGSRDVHRNFAVAACYAPPSENARRQTRTEGGI